MDEEKKFEYDNDRAILIGKIVLPDPVKEKLRTPAVPDLFKKKEKERE